MKRAITNSIACLLCTILFSTAFGQKGGALNGVVKDSTNAPLMYATVSVFGSKGVEPIKTTYTNDKGVFKITSLDTGSYNVVVSHLGYEDHSTKLEHNGETQDMGVIKLVAAAKAMEGVTVKSKKPLVEVLDDKVVFNVENDPSTKMESAIDILRKTPFVSVDGDNNVAVNGQTNFKVLLNGRETAMFAQNVKEALKGFPGSLIVKIEVITSPSAKYDAEGVGGIINIITKKKVVGYNGSINTWNSTVGWYNVNTNFSAKFGNIGVTLNYGAGGGHRVPGKTRMETIPVNTTAFSRRLLTGKRLMNNFWNFGNAELSYDIDSLNIVSVYGNVSGGNNRVSFDQDIITSYETGPDSISTYDLVSRNQYPTVSVGADYIRKFAKNKEREFSLRLNGEFGDANTYLNSVMDNQVSTDRYVINESVAKNKQYTVQSDYIHPLKKGMKVEGGIKAIWRRATSDFESKLKSAGHEEYETNPDNTDRFRYDQDVYSVYGSYSFKVKKTNFRIGARIEHTEVDGDFLSSNTKVKQGYTNLLPNIQASLKLSNAF